MDTTDTQKQNNAGWHLRRLKESEPEAYMALLTSRTRAWGMPPLQSMARCVDHMCSLLIVTCQRCKGDGLTLSEKEVNEFLKAPGASS